MTGRRLQLRAAVLLCGLILVTVVPGGSRFPWASATGDTEPWDPRGPYVAELVFRTRSPSGWQVSIEDQVVDYVAEPWQDDTQLQDFIDHWTNIRVNRTDSYSFESLGFNCARYPYNVTAFRRALALATDKAQFAIDMWGAGHGHPLDTMMPPTYGVWHNSETTPELHDRRCPRRQSRTRRSRLPRHRCRRVR
jgi:ABC-type transport system substrate-binding protein